MALLRDRHGRRIGTLAISKDITERVALERRLRELSITDSLTGLYNQRHLKERAESEVQRARRQKEPFSILLMDIDDFKATNDRFGHLEGDRVLRHAAEAIRRSIRKDVDVAFRYGGDEFVVLLPGSGPAKAEIVARRIQLAALPSPAVGLSIGIASLRGKDNFEALLRRADARMYQIKRKKKAQKDPIPHAVRAEWERRQRPADEHGGSRYTN
ncbi:MAG: diguanylate cyclase [Elusimicrobia bacterium]|nr:diguanylate cyclase [Elusimicrobiota bacterium]